MKIIKQDFAILSFDELVEHKRYEQNIPDKIKLHVLERDRWSCRGCNSNNQIKLHHIIYRSEGIDHHPDNLVTLCFNCHRRIHDGELKVVCIDGNFFFGGVKRWY